ncbi:YchF1 [Symbiodinium necroappetens]|nr:YchF1 [Symbiodinium microadriaticum]CAE7940340.1 YchF1 [Symbiodinium necroappetens]CAE7942848.1 YchF1 [Symbiodinium sp. KB8]
MPPKKKVEEEAVGPWMLGRWSRALKVGLVGMPNVGKSTLYNTLSKSHHSKTANVPFCTIDPTETRAFLEDDRFDWLVAQHKPKNEVKAFVTVVDIAGLISGAHKGEGLGNAFLSHIQSVDGIVHVMRAFEDDDVIHAEDTVDPVRDINTICSELRLKDISYMKGKVEFHKKGHAAARTKSPAHLKKWEEELETMEKVISWLEDGKDIKNGMEKWSTKDIEFINDYGLLTAKPCMYAINMNKKDFCRKKNKFLKPIYDWVQANSPGSAMIPYCGAYEEELQDMETEEERQKQLTEDGVVSAMPKMITTAFHMVHLINFFTAGPDEVKAWTVRKGYKAPQAAGVIHSDFEKGFIMAEVMAYTDLKELGSEAAVKAAGKYRQEGKGYEVQDGDVIFFKFNLGKGK